MTNKITINGVEIELTDEQAKAVYGSVPEKEENKNPYDIDCIKEDEPFYIITHYGADEYYNKDLPYVQRNKERANVFNNKEYAHQIDLQHTLYRLMDSYSWEHGKEEVDWENPNKIKYHCYFNNATKEFLTYGGSLYNSVGVVYFKNRETAKNCIEEVIKPFIAKHPEFKL